MQQIIHNPKQDDVFCESHIKSVNIAMRDGDASLAAILLGQVVRTKNVSKLSREINMSREGLYKALSAKGNPSFFVMMKIASELGLTFTLVKSEKE